MKNEREIIVQYDKHLTWIDLENKRTNHTIYDHFIPPNNLKFFTSDLIHFFDMIHTTPISNNYGHTVLEIQE